MRKLVLLFAVLAMLASCIPARANAEAVQMDIPYMENWPELPTPFQTRDWAGTAKNVIKLMLNENADYPYFPATSYSMVDTPSAGGFTGDIFRTLSYLHPDAGSGEAVTQLAAVLTMGLLDNVDPRSLNGRDYVKMAQAYYGETPDGRGFISNDLWADDCTDSYWYTLYPTLLYFHLAALYPEDETFTSHMRSVADTWLDALSAIDTWDSQGVSLKDRATVAGDHAEPEGVFGAAYVMLAAYGRFGGEAYLDAAVSLMRKAANRIDNPYYEILGSYAPYIAARLNAEQNAGLPLGRMLDWVFSDGSNAARTDWGMMNGRWGEYDAYGLSGSLSDYSHGYAFAMNTFVTAGAIAPVARYAPEYSRAVGKYILAVANSSQMFLADGLPLSLQDDKDYVSQTGLVSLVYEGLRNRSKTTPYATGDIKGAGRTGTNFSFYSAGPIGLLYAMLENTGVPEILCVDLLKTDFWHGAAYPTYLLYNPLADSKTVKLNMGDERVNVYDVVSGEFLATDAAGDTKLEIPGDTAVQAVLIPAGLGLVRQGNRLQAGGVTVSYCRGTVDMPGLEESAVIKEETQISLCANLPENDGVAFARVTYGNTTLYEGDTLPRTVTLSPETLGTGLGVLKLTVDTLGGDILSCSKGVGLVAADSGKALLALDGQGLYALAKPSDDCTCILTEEGLRLNLAWGGATIDSPALAAGMSSRLYVLVDIASATGRWGLSCLVNGEERYIRADSCAEGEFLCDLDPLPADTDADGTETSLILRVFANGIKDDIVIRSITVIKGGK
ncbi:MAG: hypothetical protein JW811_01430 [Clostridiales bacterium]|nr:hypothetical protein [Clostridiales bacterium]